MNNIDPGLAEQTPGMASQALEAAAKAADERHIPADLAVSAFVPLRFDPDKFMQFIEGHDLTEAQVAMLLRAYWDIMVGFVDVAFGVHPVQQIVDRLPPGRITSVHRATALVSLPANTSNPKRKTAARSRRAPATKEDS